MQLAKNCMRIDALDTIHHLDINTIGRHVGALNGFTGAGWNFPEKVNLHLPPAERSPIKSL